MNAWLYCPRHGAPLNACMPPPGSTARRSHSTLQDCMARPMRCANERRQLIPRDGACVLHQGGDEAAQMDGGIPERKLAVFYMEVHLPQIGQERQMLVVEACSKIGAHANSAARWGSSQTVHVHDLYWH